MLSKLWCVNIKNSLCLNMSPFSNKMGWPKKFDFLLNYYEMMKIVYEIYFTFWLQDSTYIVNFV